MSAQFGTLSFDGKTATCELVDDAYSMIKPYGPDGRNCVIKDNLAILYCAFHTTKESRQEVQPHVSRSGSILTWDGRLDNRPDLIAQLGDATDACPADVSLVAMAYEQWGSDCFPKLIGDWAVSIWNPHEQALILAKDFAGIRPLYYAVNESEIRWCTILDPLVLLAKRTFKLNEEYLAGCLVSYPSAHLTPYVGVQSVPPSCYVRVEAGRQKITRYWDFNSDKRIFHHTDREYEEHFRAVFAQSVRRRLRSDAPILSELSGGMDSSSIVCMADRLTAEAGADAPRLDTVSYYDNSEPNWNELPYFTKVEEQRGRTGYHVDVGSQHETNDELKNIQWSVRPGGDGRPTELAQKYFDYIKAQGYRVLLTGIGGDEALGGNPNALPELADLLVSLRFRQLAHQLAAWSLSKKRPWIHLLFETMASFVPAPLRRSPEQIRKAPWLHPRFVRRHHAIFRGLDPPFSLFGPLPSFQSRIFTLAAMRDELAAKYPNKYACTETRYPYLDKDLLEFLYAIPREQLVRPGQRRSLMRRALVGIVPKEILERRRKAFVVRKLINRISSNWANISQITQSMALDSLGIIDATKLREALQVACSGREVAFPLVTRPLALELWVRGLLQPPDPLDLACQSDGKPVCISAAEGSEFVAHSSV